METKPLSHALRDSPPNSGALGSTHKVAHYAKAAPIRGGLGKEDELCAMPRAPLIAGAVAAGDWGVEP